MKYWSAPQGLHIAPAELGDAAELARLHAAGFYRGWPREDFEVYLADPKLTPGYVACDSRRRIAGFALLRVAGAEAEVLTITVDRRRRGRGLGHALMRAAIDDLEHAGVKAVFLEVEHANAPALALYRTLGFSVVGRREGYYKRADGTAATALVMRLELG